MDNKLLKALQETKPVANSEVARYYKGFIYGEYGVGKTVVSAACSRNKGLLVRTDTGNESLFNHPEINSKIEVVEYQGLSHLTAIAKAVEEKIEGYDNYDLVIIDTISQIQEEYQDFLMENYTNTKREKASIRGGAAAAKNLGLDSELDVIGFGDYQLTRDKLRPVIKSLVKAPVDVLFLAHLREPSFLEEQKGTRLRRPTLTEAVFKVVAREATFLGLMEREGVKRTIQFETNKRTAAKSRIGALDNKTIDADALPTILHNWKEGK